MPVLAMSSKDGDNNETPSQAAASNEKKGKKRRRSDGGSSSNEWGIPTSASLPPLGPLPSRNGQKAPTTLPNGGKITMVGSGPGDPDLLTVKAYKLLTENPDALVVVDRLVSPAILNIIASQNVKVARKLPGCAELAQEELYWWCYQGLNRGLHVIRLKIGDPFVFGRGGEEVLTFRNQFGVEPSVIPGVSAAFSAPLLGGIPVTHRGVSNQVVMCTGYGRNGTSPDLIRYHKEQTVVFLMAVGRLHELCQRLVDMAGYPVDTPVAIVEQAGCPNQRTVVGNMATIADIAKRYNVQPPSTIVVGDVVNVLLDKDEISGQHVTGLIQNYTASMY
jgi:uroporphyrin-III C-methyltransferase